MTDLTPKAEALREKAISSIESLVMPTSGDVIDTTLRIIVEQLGVTENTVNNLRQISLSYHQTGLHLTAESLEENADSFATLLELANHGE